MERRNWFRAVVAALACGVASSGLVLLPQVRAAADPPSYADAVAALGPTQLLTADGVDFTFDNWNYGYIVDDTSGVAVPHDAHYNNVFSLDRSKGPGLRGDSLYFDGDWADLDLQLMPVRSRQTLVG